MPKPFTATSSGSDNNPHLKAGDLLEPIMAFLGQSGMSKAALLAECHLAIKSATKSRSTLKVVHVRFTQEGINVVNRWLRDPVYLNQVGRPEELPLRGARSFGSLVRACGATAAPSIVLAQLIEFGIVRKVASGKYRLIRRLMDFGQKEYVPFEPNFKFLVDATRAATSRLKATTKTPNVFWQCADNLRIPRHLTKDFLRFAHQRSLSFMYEINDWLDQHESRDSRVTRSRGQLRRFGVGLFGINSNR